MGISTNITRCKLGRFSHGQSQLWLWILHTQDNNHKLRRLVLILFRLAKYRNIFSTCHLIVDKYIGFILYIQRWDNDLHITVYLLALKNVTIQVKVQIGFLAQVSDP